ncbi:hypothetical protein [Listeria phage List-36]|uniref:Uncharacterized protein n=14 Tax=Pecentumvirus TaxID=1857844 RepID=S4U6S8_9CAUD|nr:hypothetical protein QLX35_gp030 [Listeria phage LP-125]YP_009042825.1 hypothetical protein LP048_017 [Listeria phage LP-048]YP_009043535.1 hypothetical protein HH35_gp124 [Listeria phage List-36]YP_009044482.1 hypothetical protein LP083-2_025 [Listeria phage LP-083-2]YP_009055612.1 hypothetical protein LD12_gp024 [Listeria phage LMTA-148]YP_009592559.1 hypothetical protein FDG78_gp030 [Listeria phage LP-064]YP_009784647.1 hypothetical protein QLX40_gp135 [Listeria phage LP-124]YP_406495.
MELPKHIIVKIKRAGHHNKKANDLQTEVRKWLESRLTDGESLPDYIGDQLIDALELGVDGSEALLKFLAEYEE